MRIVPRRLLDLLRLPHNRCVRLDTVCDPGWSGTACPFNSSPCLLLPAGVLKPSAPSNTVFSGLQPSRSALSVTIAPRLLSCLRIKRPITGPPARLDTWPVANGYQGGIPTRSFVRHCQVGTETWPAFLSPEIPLCFGLSFGNASALSLYM